MKKIIKRDGRKVNFDQSKIYDAISSAFDACDKRNKQSTIEKITDEVIAKIDSQFKDEIPYVEDVQDIIEKTLIKHNQADVAKAFIVYRFNRNQARNARSALNLKVSSILGDRSKQTNYEELLESMGIETGKEYFSSFIVSPKIIEAVNSGDIYIKSLYCYGLSVLNIDLEADELLAIPKIKQSTSSYEFFTELFGVIENLHGEISGSIAIRHFEKIIYFASNIYETKSEDNIKKFSESYYLFIKLINSSASKNLKLKIYFGDIATQNNTNTLRDFLNFSLKTPYLFPEEHWLYSQTNKPFIIEKINSNNYPFIEFADPLSNNIFARYFINFTHIVSYCTSKEKLEERIHYLFSLISQSIKERKEVLLKRNNGFLQQLLLVKGKNNIEELLTLFDIRVSFDGFYEFKELKHCSMTIEEIISVLQKESKTLECKGFHTVLIDQVYDVYSSYWFANKDKEFNRNHGKAYYSSSFYFPNYIETSLGDKINYENQYKIFVESSPSIFYFEKGKINIETLLDTLKEKNVTSAVIFQSIDEKIQTRNPNSYPVYILSDLKKPNSTNLSQSYMAKTLTLK